MAVQAQYPPSNVLLLNRNMQEVNGFSLQPQPAGGGLFLVQSTPQILFTNGSGGGGATAAGAGNQRRIGREMQAATVNFDSSSNNNNINNNSMLPFNTIPATISLQPQTTQLIDLAQLRNHQPSSNVVSTGLRLSIDDKQQLQHRQQQQGGLIYNSTPSSLESILSEDFASESKQQREEIDRFLHAQGEYLRHVLADKQQRHHRALLVAAEESVTRRLREKEAEVKKVARRQEELEARAAQLAVEAQQWQAKAREQEAVAASLQAQLQQAKVTASWCDWGDEEAAVDGSGGRVGDPEDAESAYVDPERMEMVGPRCKACRSRAATVVVLPCRHLCSCTECDQLAQVCPLCFYPRSSSVEVYLS